jgi:hypothetical protein
MAARYALVQFTYHDTVANQEITVIQGANHDSVTGQAFLQTPASYWSTTPLSASAGQITAVLAGYLTAYPATI